VNYYDTLIEVADDCPVSEAELPHARGGKKTKALVEYELLVKHPYTYSQEDVAFEVYALLHSIPKRTRLKERERFLSKGHPHLRVSALAKRYGWGLHNNSAGKVALIAVGAPAARRRPPRRAARPRSRGRAAGRTSAGAYSAPRGSVSAAPFTARFAECGLVE